MTTPPKYFLERLMSLPHRGNGTLEIDQAAQIIFDEYLQMGLTPRISEFKTGEISWFKESTAIIFVLLALGSGFMGAFLLSVILFILGVSLFPEFPYHWKKFILLVGSCREKDVFAQVLPKNRPYKKTIVIFGHYDTPKECRGLSLLKVFVHTKLGNRMATDSRHMLPFLRSPLFLLNVATVLVIPAILIRELSVFHIIAVAFSAPVLVLYLYQFLETAMASAVPGAFDNGTGAATVLSLADYFSKNPLENTRIIFLNNAAEEGYIDGFDEFLKMANIDKETTAFINLESIGAKYLCEGYGEASSFLGLAYYYDSRLATLVKKHVDNNSAAFPVKEYFVPLSGDGMVLLSKKCRMATTLMSVNKGGFVDQYHQMDDTMDKIHFETLVKCRDFVAALVKELDKENF